MAKKTTMHPNLTQWSYSRWQVYERCPQQALFKFIMKYPEAQGPALARGEQIHKEAEDYINRKVKTLSPNLALVKGTMEELRKAKAKSELEMAITRAWEPTGWWDKDVWGRAKLDAHRPLSSKIMEVKDWKTGKYKPGDEGYKLQLELYGVFTFATFPRIQEVHAGLVFTDHGKEEPRVFKKEDEMLLRKKWENRTRAMLNDTVYAPRPGHYCGWCSYAKAKGGPCQY